MERNFKRVRRQIVSLLLVFAIVLSIMPLNVLAAKVEPTKVFIRVEGKDATIVHYQEMEVESFDISHINGIDKNSKAAKWHEKNKKPLVLHAIVKALEEAESSVIDPKQFEISEKGDFIKAVGGDFPKDSSGWMFKVNGVVPLITADAYELKDGDVIELFYVPDWSNYHFTKIEASKDKVNVGEEVIFTFTAKKEEWDKDNDYEPTKNAKVNIKGKEEVYTTDENGQVAIKFEEPGKYIIEVQEVEGLNIIRPIPVEIVVEEKKATAEEQKDEDIKKTINDATNWKIENDDIGEWEALSIKRAGKDIPKEYLEKLKEDIINKKGEMGSANEYSKIVLIASSLGIDGRNIFGYNFIEKIYNDEKLVGEFTSNAIYGLIALDSRDYAIPKKAKWSREQILGWLISIQNEDGGFGYKKGVDSDVDMTAMALQALSEYQNKKEVKEATEKALDFISSRQEKDGGFVSWGADSSESVSQTIIALASLDIDPKTDRRFIKEGNLIEKLFTFKASDGGFYHVLEEEESNSIATEQALGALVAYDRFLEGKTKYFDMTDVEATELPKEPVFKDMDKVSKWAVPCVEKVKEYNLMVGRENNLFAPKDNITRAEFAAILLRLMEEEPVKECKQAFKDVPKNKWYYKDVMKAYEKGIMLGRENNKFAPEEYITREEMAAIVSRLVIVDENIKKAKIKDIDKAGKWAKDAIYIANYKGIMIGDNNGYFRPKDKTTREMAAAIIIRLADEIN